MNGKQATLAWFADAISFAAASAGAEDLQHLGLPGQASMKHLLSCAGTKQAWVSPGNLELRLGLSWLAPAECCGVPCLC